VCEVEPPHYFGNVVNSVHQQRFASMNGRLKDFFGFLDENDVWAESGHGIFLLIINENAGLILSRLIN
jgi:hypothetical protein